MIGNIIIGFFGYSLAVLFGGLALYAFFRTPGDPGDVPAGIVLIVFCLIAATLTKLLIGI